MASVSQVPPAILNNLSDPTSGKRASSDSATIITASRSTQVTPGLHGFTVTATETVQVQLVQGVYEDTIRRLDKQMGDIEKHLSSMNGQIQQLKDQNQALEERSRILQEAARVTLPSVLPSVPVVSLRLPALPPKSCSAQYTISRRNISGDTVDFGMGIVWKMTSKDLAKVQGWAPSQMIEISFRDNMWALSSNKELRYCITNTTTKETFFAGFNGIKDEEMQKRIGAVDGNTLTILFSDGSRYHAAPNGHAGNCLANLKPGLPALIIKEEEGYTFVTDYTRAGGFSLLAGAGDTDNLKAHLAAVRQAEIDAAKKSVLDSIDS